MAIGTCGYMYIEIPINDHQHGSQDSEKKLENLEITWYLNRDLKNLENLQITCNLEFCSVSCEN